MKKSLLVIISLLALIGIGQAGILDRFSDVELVPAPDNFIRMPELSSAPATPVSGHGIIYTIDGDTYFKNDDGVATSLVKTAVQDVPAGGTSTVLVLTNSIFTVGADAGGDIVTLANGFAGQSIYIICEDATGTVTITPATFNGGTSITFDALGDAVTLVYTTGTGWSITGGNSYTII